MFFTESFALIRRGNMGWLLNCVYFVL